MIKIGLDMYLNFGEEELLYWRKANQIHSWFVINCANGNAEKTSDMVEVSINDLIKLKDTIKEVLNNKDKANKLLPTQPGFFFGSYEYDEYYYEELDRTYNELLRIIDRISSIDLIFDNKKLTYWASW